jgi:hypothetical protein
VRVPEAKVRDSSNGLNGEQHPPRQETPQPAQSAGSLHAATATGPGAQRRDLRLALIDCTGLKLQDWTKVTRHSGLVAKSLRFMACEPASPLHHTHSRHT